MKVVLITVALVVSSFAFAQVKDSEDVKLKQPKEIKSSTAPVTHTEAIAVFDKAWSALAKGLKVKGTNPVKLTKDNNPITKNEVLAAIKSMVDNTKSMFKRSATPTPFKAERLRKDFDQATYTKLIKDGFVMPVGPLVVGKDGPVSTHEFGDSIGVVLIRISDLIHMPSRKFSPDIMGGRGIGDGY